MTTQSEIPAVSVPTQRIGTDTVNIVLAAVVATILVVAAVVNVVATFSFPSNAPVEWVWAIGISIDLIGCAVALAVRLAIIVRRPRTLAAATPGPGPIALAGAIISLVVLLGWLLLGGAAFLVHATTDPAQLRYYLDVNGAFFLGVPWMLGLFFGVVAFRRGRGPWNDFCAIVAIVLPLLIVIASLYSSIAYGRGLTD